MKQYAGDFETTTTTNFKVEGEVRVWGVNLTDIESLNSVLTTNNMDDFFDFIQKESCEIYFHNLKFDGNFILNELFKRGYIFSDSKKKKEKTFETLITDQGVWFSITIYHKVYNKRYLKTTIFDSFKKLPFSVSRIAQSWQLDTQKLVIDYDKFREEGYHITEEEIKYLEADTQIMAQALKIQHDAGLDKMTIASNALTNYTELLGKNNFNMLYPKLNIIIDDDIRKAYKGGYTFLNEKFRNKELHNVVSYDVNSLYPYVMYDRNLPYGLPKQFSGRYEPNESYPLYIQYFKCSFKRRDGKIPTVQLKNNYLFSATQYLESSNEEIVKLYMTNIDLEMFLKHYEVKDVEWLGGVMFRQTNNLFKRYINFWNEEKVNNTGPKREIAKLMLNSLYGKFASTTRRQQNIPYFDEETKMVRFKKSEEETVKPVYTALATFITAYAREITITAAQNNYDRFIYADTDSIHLVGEEEPLGVEIHPTKLGAWKNEGKADRAKFLRAKTYIKEFDGKIKVTCAGMPDNIKDKVTFDNFKYGQSFSGKLQQKNVRGGTLLLDIDFTIQPIN